jgi:hypothetical protein
LEKVIDKIRLKSIVDRLLVGAPETIKLIQTNNWNSVVNFALLTDSYFFLAFINHIDMKRALDLRNKGLDPFPGLIKPDSISGPSAFRLEKSRNGVFIGNKVSNLYTFSLGRDCTVIIRDHHQEIFAKDLGVLKYSIELGYLISFGDEINTLNFYDYLEDLIAFSLKT